MDRTRLIDDIRAFNRYYTNRLGVLAGNYLGRPYTLTEARILYEIGAQERTTASAINADLGLDPGYLSRILGLASVGFLKQEGWRPHGLGLRMQAPFTSSPALSRGGSCRLSSRLYGNFPDPQFTVAEASCYTTYR